MKILFLLLLILLPSSADADGFRNPFQSGAANGQGNAFAAQADDASAVFYNPAGMTQLRGVQVLGGVEFVNVNVRFRNAAGPVFCDRDAKGSWHRLIGWTDGWRGARFCNHTLS